MISWSETSRRSDVVTDYAQLPVNYSLTNRLNATNAKREFLGQPGNQVLTKLVDYELKRAASFEAARF